MTLWSDPHIFADGDAIGAYRLNRYLRDPLLHLSNGSLPQRATLWHYQSHVVTGNAITLNVDSGCFGAHYAFQSASADGDTWTQSAVLLPGAYRFCIIFRMSSSGGRLDVSIGDLLEVSQLEFYSAVTSDYNLSLSRVYIETPGRYTITGVTNGKDAASSAYNIMISSMSFRPAPTSTGGDY